MGAGDGFWDRDEVAIEAEDDPVQKFEKNATSPGLAHPSSLKHTSIRVSHLCLRSACLQKGNCLSALGKHEEARVSYESILPLLVTEARSARVDWELHSLYINIGNTYSRELNFDKADEFYNLAQKLGDDHLSEPNGSSIDGKSMIIGAKRARVFALKKVDRVDEAKTLLLEVLDEVREVDKEREEIEKKKKEKEELDKLNKE